MIPVLVDPVKNNGFRATSGPPLPIRVEAGTLEDAITSCGNNLQAD